MLTANEDLPVNNVVPLVASLGLLEPIASSATATACTLNSYRVFGRSPVTLNLGVSSIVLVIEDVLSSTLVTLMSYVVMPGCPGACQERKTHVAPILSSSTLRLLGSLGVSVHTNNWGFF